MGYMAKDSGGGSDFEPVPVGTYIARCVTVCDLGIQQTGFGNKEKLYIGWEVPAVRVEWEKDGVKHEGPALIGSRYTLSIHEKSILGQHLLTWRGVPFTEEERAGFDVLSVLNAPCMISVTHATKGEKTYANVSSVMRLMQGQVAPAAETPVVGYSPMHPQFNSTIEQLPEWLKKLSLEGQGVPAQAAPPAYVPPPAAPLPTAEQQLGHTAMNPAAPGPDDFDDDIPF